MINDEYVTKGQITRLCKYLNVPLEVIYDDLTLITQKAEDKGAKWETECGPDNDEI